MKRPETIEILTRGVCIKKGCLLVCQSKGAANTYLPGGHVEWREQSDSALVREIEEELGVKSEVKDLLGAVEHTFIQKGRRHCEINLVFRVSLPGLSPDRAPSSRESWISFKWVPLTALARNHLEPWCLRELIPLWGRRRSRIRRWGSTLL